MVSRALVALDEPVLSYWLNYDITTYGTDGLYTYIITNYDTIQLDYIGAGGALPPFLTFHMGWARFEYSIPLSFGDTFRVAFRFVSDSSETAQGFFVDDITLSGLSTEWMGSVWEKPDKSGFDIICAPNPFNKTVTIAVDGISSGKIYIFDVLGRLVYRGKLAGKPVVWQPSALNSGVYFVRIVGQGKVANKRILYIK
ncbi:T9SS type A sorting domain-containing protein [bacterium]|nr:T9SS type A sorting domain-containing protein [bacterium]